MKLFKRKPKPLGVKLDAGSAAGTEPELKLVDLCKLELQHSMKIRFDPHPSDYEYRYNFTYTPSYRYGVRSYTSKPVEEVGLTVCDLEARVMIEKGDIILKFRYCPTLRRLAGMMAEVQWQIEGILKDYQRFEKFSKLEKK
ncbi:MAG: hypothetical protein E3J60_01235 [Dehalococcoidia bacterium]|nr:MAG: hypothetical protein E3J60_01235 [Dehalococcoidia bacterium]